MEQLRQGIGLQAIRSERPAGRIQLNGYEMFDAMTESHPGGYREAAAASEDRAEGRT